MKSKVWNPLTVFVAACFVLIAVVLWWFGRGESLSVIFKILFAPFSLDISRGVGDAGAQIFRWIAGASYLAVIAMIVLRHFARETVAKNSLTSIGILLAIAHFCIVGLGYVSTGIH